MIIRVTKLLLNLDYPNIEPFKEVIPFLKENRICKALTEKHKCYESPVRTFWSSARYDEKDQTIYSAVKIKDDKKKDIDLEVKIIVVDIRRVLDLQDKDDDQIIIPERLCKGFWIRMGYTWHINDKGKGAYDETSNYIMNIIACLVLNRPYNISQVIFNHMVDNIKGEKYIMYPRFIQMLLDDQILNLLKDPKDELVLHHMDSETLKSLDKYIGVKLENKARYKQKIEKKKSPPRLIDETVVPPIELIKKDTDLLNMSFDEYLKRTATEATKATQDTHVEKDAEKTAENVEASGEGLVHTDSSATETDKFDPTKIAPTSYISGKQKYKRSPKKKKASDEEDATYEPTPKGKKKVMRKLKAHPTGAVPRSVRAKKGTTKAPEVETIKVPEVERAEHIESPKYERVEKADKDVEVEFMGLVFLEKAKAKAEAEREEAKENLEVVKVENVALKKELEEHAEVIDQLSEEIEEHAKVIDQLTDDIEEDKEEKEKEEEEEDEELKDLYEAIDNYDGDDDNDDDIDHGATGLEDQHHEASSYGTQHAGYKVYLTLLKVTYLQVEVEGELEENRTQESMLEELGMDDGNMKYDIEDEIPPSLEREYLFKFVNEADNFKDVIIGEDSDLSEEDTPFHYTRVDEDFPTLTELFKSHNEDEVRRKVVERIYTKEVPKTIPQKELLEERK
ncbi:hypothetical protein Hanom_Chr16g01427781 [Helianthus anomalus]